jgi:tetratricopeptide (TPR) repeat protein
MAELRLVFQPAPDTTMTVRVDFSSADGGMRSGGQPQPFGFQLRPEDYADIRWYLEEFMDLPIGGFVLRANHTEQSLIQWGRDLYKAVFDYGDHRDVIRDLMHAEPPRLLTIATSDGDILRLPWELMADERGALTRRDVTIRRQLETGHQPLAYDIGAPLRLLLVVSRPDNTGFIDPRHSTRAMLDAFTSLGDNVTVEFCRPPTLARLEERLAESNGAYDIVHFDGHGHYDRLLGLGVLLFEKAQQPGQARVDADPVRADDLGNLLARYHIPLVILEACRSSEVGDVAFRSVAPRLIEAGVGSVIAMSYAVHVEAARILLTRFYRELARGRSIGQAMESGRAALMAQRDRWLEYGPQGKSVQLQDWFLPQLYQRGSDMRLVEPAARPDTRQEPARVSLTSDRPRFPTGQHIGAFPRPPLYNFHGRARELYALERSFRTDRAILLHAMGGMGKTTLAREAGDWLTRTGLFPEGACFLSFEQPVTAERIAQVLGSYLEGHGFEALSQVEQLDRARQLFQGQDMLMVWDNFESVLETFDNATRGPRPVQDSADTSSAVTDAIASGYTAEERMRILTLFRDWTEDPAGHGRLLITCRPREAGLPGVRRMELAGLARPDSLYLLAQVLRRHDTSLDDKRFEKANLEALLDVLGDHPLSIELVGPHLKQLTPEQIVADFHELLDQFTGDAEVERNRSLLASLRFSTSRLSAQAQDALPWLGLFQGGVFEQLLLAVSQMDPAAWDGMRAELEATALVRMETHLGQLTYLRFHPTLPYAVRGAVLAAATASQAEAGDGRPGLADQEDVRQRFIAVYHAWNRAIHEALRGSAARSGMDLLVREEANVRTAVRWAVASDQFDVAAEMGDTFLIYLQMSARLRERDQWSAWLADAAAHTTFSAAVAVVERHRAWSLCTQGHAAEAVRMLDTLIERLQQTTTFDAAFELASAQAQLGRIYQETGYDEQAIPILRQAADAWERLVGQATNLSLSETIEDLLVSETQEAKQRQEACAERLQGLSATLARLASALRSVRRLDEALSTIEQAIDIARALGHDRNAAAGLGQMASILMDQGRYQEADTRYNQALEAARRLSDQELEGVTLQQQGVLADNMQQYDRAIDLYKQALIRFQNANNDGAVMRTCNLLGVVEQKVRHQSEARAWYERSREIAERRGDTVSLAIAAQNIGIVCQEEGEAARQNGDEATARQRFAEAEHFLQESLQMTIDRQDKPGEAMSRGQLSQVFLLLGELDKAEVQAHQAREIFENLGLKEVHMAYHDLAQIARARGDEAQAAQWEAKRDEVVEELVRRARGGAAADAGLSQQMLQAITQLAVACVQAGLGGTGLPSEVESDVAWLESENAGPLRPLGHYLRRLATGPASDTVAALASPPAGLPDPLPQLIAHLRDAVRTATGG